MGSFFSYTQNGKSSTSSIGRSEIKVLLHICQSRASVNDPRLIPHSLLRYWICRIWFDIPTSRPTNPTTLEISLHWINDLKTPLKHKEPVFHLLKRELLHLGVPGKIQ